MTGWLHNKFLILLIEVILTNMNESLEIESVTQDDRLKSLKLSVARRGTEREQHR